MLGDKWKGYPIGAIVTDWLLSEHRSWLKKALAYCHDEGDSTAQRSRLFAKYVKNKWPGGFAAMDRELRRYINEKARKYGN